MPDLGLLVYLWSTPQLHTKTSSTQSLLMSFQLWGGKLAEMSAVGFLIFRDVGGLGFFVVFTNEWGRNTASWKINHTGKMQGLEMTCPGSREWVKGIKTAINPPWEWIQNPSQGHSSDCRGLCYYRCASFSLLSFCITGKPFSSVLDKSFSHCIDFVLFSAASTE